MSRLTSSIARGASVLVFLALPAHASGAPFAYITNSGDNTVSVIDTSTDTVTTTISVGGQPCGVAISPDGTRVYVTNGADDTVSVIDAIGNVVIATVPIASGGGAAPDEGIAITPDGLRLYVPGLGVDLVSVVDTTTLGVLTTIPSIGSPRGAVVDSTGLRAYVTNRTQGSISVIDTSSNTVSSTIALNNTGLSGITVSPDGSRVYAASIDANRVYVIDTSTNALTTTITVSQQPSGIAVSPDGSQLYVASNGINVLEVIATATDSVIASIPVGLDPVGVSVTPDGARVYVANTGSNTVSVVDSFTLSLVDTVHVGMQPLAFGQFITPNTESTTSTTSSTTTSSSNSTSTTTIAPTEPLNVVQVRLRRSSLITMNGSVSAKGDFLTAVVAETVTSSDGVRLRIQDALTTLVQQAWSADECAMSTSGTLTCRSVDRTAKLKLTRFRSTPAHYRFTTALRRLPIYGPFAGPVAVAVSYGAGIDRVGSTGSCGASGSGLRCPQHDGVCRIAILGDSNSVVRTDFPGLPQQLAPLIPECEVQSFSEIGACVDRPSSLTLGDDPARRQVRSASFQHLVGNSRTRTPTKRVAAALSCGPGPRAPAVRDNGLGSSQARGKVRSAGGARGYGCGDTGEPTRLNAGA